MLEKLFSSLFGTGNVIFISFGLGLSDDGSDLFYLYFSLIFLFQLNHPLFYSLIFLFPAIFISSLISSVKSTKKILLGIPLFSIFSLVYARIGIGTIEVTANTQQVLAVPAQTAKLLLQHRPNRVTSCPTDLDTVRYGNPCTMLAD